MGAEIWLPHYTAHSQRWLMTDDESGATEPVESPGAGRGHAIACRCAPTATWRRGSRLSSGIAGAVHRPVGRRRGRGHSHLPAGARPPSGRYPTARAQMRCRRGVWRPRAAQPSARPRSNCRDRPLLCREAHVHEGQQWTTRWWLRIARSVWPFLPKKKKGRNTFLLHRRCVFAVPSIFLFFSEPTLGLVSRSACVWVLAL